MLCGLSILPRAALEKMAKQTGSAKNVFDSIQSTIDDQLLPDLKTTRQRIDLARTTLESLQSVLKSISSFIPGFDLNAPARTLTDLIASTHSLDTEISNVEGLATQASTFVSDTSYLLGGDLTGTARACKTLSPLFRNMRRKWMVGAHRIRPCLKRRLDGSTKPRSV